MRFFSIILFSFFSATSFAQKPALSSDRDSSFVLVRTYQGDIVNAAMDNFDNIYIISSTGQIKKFNANGDSIAVYNQVKNFGNLYSIDVTNPLKILLFYKDFSTIVILDRFLANLSTIDLRKLSILQPDAVGLSYDNKIWVFDEYDNKLKKIDEYGNILMETPDFRTIFNENIVPQKIISDNGFVYLADTANGVYVFDNYGSFKKVIPLKNWQSIAVNNSNVISTNNEMITVYNTATLLQTQKKTPFFKPYIHSFTNANKFITFSNNSLQIYQYRF